VQAFLIARVIAAGWRRTLPAAFAPLISDGPIAILALTLLHHVAHGFENILKAAGGVVFLYFALKAFLEWRKLRHGAPIAVPSSPRTLLQAVVVNLLNPAPYLGWSLILGPLMIEAWGKSPAHAAALVSSFYAVMVLSLALTIVLAGTTSFLGPRGRQALLLASAFALAAVAVYALWSALLNTSLSV
jgi:threonine/homoserine/homoserine lactone efflux protein